MSQTLPTFPPQQSRDISQAIVVTDGLVVCAVTCELALCRVTPGRNVHSILLIISLLSVVSVPVSLVVSCLYFVSLFFELSYHLRMPVLGEFFLFGFLLYHNQCLFRRI
jgi:hypothetical protein